MTPLHWTAEYGHTDAARLLIEKGVDLSVKDYHQQTPLDLAGKRGHTDIVKLLEGAEKKSGQEPGQSGDGTHADTITQEREVTGDKKSHR
jgi:hypothetical protein